MTSANVEQVRLVGQAWTGLDMVQALVDDDFVRGVKAWAAQRWDPNFEFQFVGPGPLEQPAVSGINDFLRVWREWVEPWESFRFEEFGEPVEVSEDQVLVPVRQRACSKEAGLDTEVKSAAILTFHEGKLRRWDAYLYEADALEAAQPALASSHWSGVGGTTLEPEFISVARALSRS
jgi:hypothetical protein